MWNEVVEKLPKPSILKDLVLIFYRFGKENKNESTLFCFPFYKKIEYIAII